MTDELSGGVDLGILGLTNARLLGRGGFGSVYRADEPALHRAVAVKVLNPVQGDDSVRLDRELRALGMLGGHPHIVMVHGTGVNASGSPYIVMELMTGGSLGDRLVKNGPLPWSEVAAIGVQIAGALETAHRSGVLHRDLKPENILVSSLNEVKLADFGIARVDGANQTKTGAVTTSLAYAAPEILAGRGPSAASDVYGLAAALFSLLAGSSPFVRPTDESLLPMINRIASEPVPDLRPRGIPSALCAVLERALAKDPDGRTGSALVFARELQAAQQALGIPVTSVMVEGERDAERPAPATATSPGSTTPPPGATVVVSASSVAPAPAGYPPQGAVPPGFPPQGAAPPGFPPQAAAPAGFPPQGAAPAGFPPQGAPGQSGAPQGFLGQGFPGQGFPGQGFPGQGYPGQAPKRKGLNPALIAAAGVGVLAIVGLGAFLVTSGGDDTSAPTRTTTAQGSNASRDPIAFFGFTEHRDASRRISFQAPSEWRQVDGLPAVEEGRNLPKLEVSTDLRALAGTWDVPGVSVVLVDVPYTSALARQTREAGAPVECRYNGSGQIDSDELTGEYDEYINCAGSSTSNWVFSITDRSRQFVVVANMQLRPSDRGISDPFEVFQSTLRVK